MAKFSNSNNGLYLNVYIEQGAQNIANNSTTVNWRVTVSRPVYFHTYNLQGDSTLSPVSYTHLTLPTNREV